MRRKVCHACSRMLELERNVGRRDECPYCHGDLHCCLNCKFYERTAPKQCREPISELVKDKTKSNFCDYFVFTEADRSGRDDWKEKTRSALNDLFKK